MDLKIGFGKYKPQMHEMSQNIPTKPGLGFWVRVLGQGFESGFWVRVLG